MVFEYFSMQYIMGCIFRRLRHNLSEIWPFQKLQEGESTKVGESERLSSGEPILGDPGAVSGGKGKS